MSDSDRRGVRDLVVEVTTNGGMSPLLLPAIEATGEAVYKLGVQGTTMTGSGHTVDALPIPRTIAILRGHKVIC